MNNVVLEYKGRYVAGYALKADRVYYSKNPEAAKRFTAVSANKFMFDYMTEEKGFTVRNIIIHTFKRGMPIADQIKLKGVTP